MKGDSFMDHKINLLALDDLIDNPTPRVPVCLCLDTSGSMGVLEEGNFKETGETIFEDGREWRLVDSVEGGKTRIDELQKGVQLFFDAINADEVAKYSAEIAIITFSDKAECIRDFGSLDDNDKVPQLKAEGNTAMGEAVAMALDHLNARKQKYKDTGVDYYQPWLVIMSDGQPNGDDGIYKKAVQDTVKLATEKKLAVFSIGIGAEADMKALGEFSPRRPALRLQGLKFKEFFEWLSQSVSRTSQSMPGDVVKLDLEGIKGWGEL